MDMQKTGQFLSQLRKEHGFTQEQLGESLGVSNKTVSRWETGMYLPPVEMLQELSQLYGVSINEMISGQRLDEEQYRKKAEENITSVMKTPGFVRRERFLVCGEWMRKHWWLLTLCLLIMGALYGLSPIVAGDRFSYVVRVSILLFFAATLISNHVLHYVSQHIFEMTGREEEWKRIQILRIVWLIALAAVLFVLTDLVIALLYALTPGGTADGFEIHTMFYDTLVKDQGSYPDNCFEAVERWLWYSFLIAVINIDLTVLNIHRTIK